MYFYKSKKKKLLFRNLSKKRYKGKMIIFNGGKKDVIQIKNKASKLTEQAKKTSSDMVKMINPDNLKKIDITNISNKVTDIGKNLSINSAENINKSINKTYNYITTYIEPLEFKKIGKTIRIVMVKSTDIYNEIKPDLISLFIEIIELADNIIDRSGPKFNKILNRLFDSISSLLNTFVKRCANLISLFIQDIIRAVPVAGEIFDMIQFTTKSILLFFEMFHKLSNSMRCMIDTIELISCTVYDNLVSINKIKSILVSIISKIGKHFLNIMKPYLSLDYIPTPEVLALNAHKLGDLIENNQLKHKNESDKNESDKNESQTKNKKSTHNGEQKSKK